MAEHYYTVGVHGPPTKETAPHGFAFRRPGHRWTFGYLPATVNIDAEWYPLPAPPTEQAPPPVPEPKWMVEHMGNGFGAIRMAPTRSRAPMSTALLAADALNALDRDGVAWGPGRPMSELPDDGLVLVQMSSGVPYTFYIRKADYIATHRNTYECWWPLPGEAQ